MVELLEVPFDDEAIDSRMDDPSNEVSEGGTLGSERWWHP